MKAIDHLNGDPTDNTPRNLKFMDYGKPGDPSGCYFPKEWRSPGKVIGDANREAVRAYFASHIGCTSVECGASLGLSVMAVGRHVATLRKEWES